LCTEFKQAVSTAGSLYTRILLRLLRRYGFCWITLGRYEHWRQDDEWRSLGETAVNFRNADKSEGNRITCLLIGGEETARPHF
jgi:hypothetical protein